MLADASRTRSRTARSQGRESRALRAGPTAGYCLQLGHPARFGGALEVTTLLQRRVCHAKLPPRKGAGLVAMMTARVQQLCRDASCKESEENRAPKLNATSHSDW